MADDSKYPRSWRWTEDGRNISGEYIQMDEAPSKYGDRVIIVLNVASEKRSLWLNETALYNKFRDELARRPGREFTPGERITATKGEAQVEGGEGQNYWPFEVTFHDAPKRSAAEMFGVDPITTSPAEAESELPADDVIPF
jgi:hypothetical protein